MIDPTACMTTRTPVTGKPAAQIRCERHGAIALFFIVAITTTPAYLWIFDKDFSFGPAAFGVLVAWIANFILMGKHRLVTAAIILTRRYPESLEKRCDDIEEFILGIAMEKNLAGPMTLEIHPDFKGPPRLHAWLGRPADPRRHILDSDTTDALTDLLIPDGNIYDLAMQILPHITVDWSDRLSSHARLSAIGSLERRRKAARDRRH